LSSAPFFRVESLYRGDYTTRLFVKKGVSVDFSMISAFGAARIIVTRPIQEGQRNMNEKMVVFVSCAGKEQAEKIAAAVVEERLAACVNVLPGVRSCYVWEGKVQWEDEVLLLMKTTREAFAGLEKRVLELHTYEVPEIVGVRIDAGTEKYLNWVGENTVS
jgi:periplasmic divalent cation tolerance protein